MEQLIPFQAILANPNSAWAITTIILIIYVVQDGKSREKRLTEIIDGTLSKMTEILGDVKERISDIEKSISKED